MENNIKAIREAKGIGQKELAQRVGISYWWMNHVENGKKRPSIRVVSRIAKELDVTIEDLGIEISDFF
ncbi:helix-turn-helix transcriptional regulator [Priestia megaterium]|uniref:helix-turn-helix transcriptional regulator n=1 Tax=Priestia megaterium TaxID=1404 RepID=UPI000CA352FA|nr:helix-turn-helix transcriptional regulator [Priestia megaterium]AUO14742.1 XRE family transcriptional regulator [Priestia megaterium]